MNPYTIQRRGNDDDTTIWRYRLMKLRYWGQRLGSGLLIVALVLTGIMILWPNRFAQLTRASEATVSINMTDVIAVDEITDPKATGYPDSRKLVRDSEGNLYVAYRKDYKQRAITRNHVYVAKSTNNGKTWKLTNRGKPIENVGDYTQRVPSIAIDSHDVLHVIWYGSDSRSKGDDDRQVKYTRSLDGGKSWVKWRSVARITGYHEEDLWQEHPTIYVGADDVLNIVWEGRDADHPKQQVKFVQSLDGGESWSKWRNIQPVPDTTFSRPTLLSNANTMYALAYAQLDPQPESQIVWTKSTDGGATWDEWGFVAPDHQDQRHVSTAVDSLGRLHAAWRQIPAATSQTDAAYTRIHYAVLEKNRWQRAEIITLRDERNQFSPSLTVDSADRAWVTWVETPLGAGFPKENPAGVPLITLRTATGWLDPVPLCTSAEVAYPNLRWQRLVDHSAVDVVWVTQQGSEAATLDYCRITLVNEK